MPKLAPSTTVTKGKLGGMKFMYNPTTYSDSQSVTYNDQAITGMSYPNIIYQGGNTRTISFVIYLSDKVQNGITEKFIKNLQTYLPKTGLKNRFAAPKKIRFAFGRFVKDCYLVGVEPEPRKFSPSLKMIEANVTVTLIVPQ